MKKLMYILLILGIIATGLWVNRKKIYQVIVTDHVNEEMPDFELQNLHGGKITSGDFRGKILVLDFWTTWCGACKRAFPDFQGLAAKYKDNDAVEFLAINTSHGGDTIDKVRTFVQNSNYTFAVAFDSAAVFSDRLDIKYYPTLMLVDVNGNIRLRHIGYSKLFENYKKTMEQHIAILLAETREVER